MLFYVYCVIFFTFLTLDFAVFVLVSFLVVSSPLTKYLPWNSYCLPPMSFHRPSQASTSSSGVKLGTSASLKSFSAPGSQLLPPVLQPSAPLKDEKTSRLENDLYVKLLKTRNSISQETGFTPHNIASNKVLLDMAKFRYTYLFMSSLSTQLSLAFLSHKLSFILFFC